MTFEARGKEHLEGTGTWLKKTKNRQQYCIFRGYNTNEVFRAETTLYYIVMG